MTEKTEKRLLVLWNLIDMLLGLFLITSALVASTDILLRWAVIGIAWLVFKGSRTEHEREYERETEQEVNKYEE